MRDIRSAVRQPTRRTGVVEFGSGSNAFDVPCTIRDVSGTGARLHLNVSVSLPKSVTLVFREGLRKTCRVAWQKRRLTGVAFADGPASLEEQALMMTEEEQALHREQIAARVREARLSRGYTEAQLNILLGGSSDEVSVAEKGETSIPLHRLMRIADLLQVDLDWLVAGSASIASPPLDSDASRVRGTANSALMKV